MTHMNKEQIKKRLMKKVGQDLTENWSWNGVQFFRLAREGVTRQRTALIHYTAGTGWIKAKISLEEFGLHDVIKRFTGNDAIEKMVEWVSERLIELDETLQQRIAPYQKGYEDYLKALNGQ